MPSAAADAAWFHAIMHLEQCRLTEGIERIARNVLVVMVTAQGHHRGVKKRRHK